MKKRYRTVTAKPGELKMAFGSTGDGCHSATLVTAWGEGVAKGNANYLMSEFNNGGFDYFGKELPSLVKELEDRGFDITTLKFSIQKKVVDDQ